MLRAKGGSGWCISAATWNSAWENVPSVCQSCVVTKVYLPRDVQRLAFSKGRLIPELDPLIEDEVEFDLRLVR